MYDEKREGKILKPNISTEEDTAYWKKQAEVYYNNKTLL